jgi:hypothetical protein
LVLGVLDLILPRLFPNILLWASIDPLFQNGAALRAGVGWELLVSSFAWSSGRSATCYELNEKLKVKSRWNSVEDSIVISVRFAGNENRHFFGALNQFN